MNIDLQNIVTIDPTNQARTCHSNEIGLKKTLNFRVTNLIYGLKFPRKSNLNNDLLIQASQKTKANQTRFYELGPVIHC